MHVDTFYFILKPHITYVYTPCLQVVSPVGQNMLTFLEHLISLLQCFMNACLRGLIPITSAMCSLQSGSDPCYVAGGFVPCNQSLGVVVILVTLQEGFVPCDQSPGVVLILVMLQERFVPCD